MASNVTLAQLRLDARLYADQRPGSADSFITETELTRLVNMKRRELYDILVAARGADYFATETTIAIASDISRYNLPADFYELASLTLEWTDQDKELMFPVGSTRLRIAFDGNWRKWSRYDAKAYRLRASQLEFLPTPTSGVTARLQYVPVCVDLVADGDTDNWINGWEKMLTLGVAIEMREIEKRPSNALVAMYQEQLERVEALKDERDAEAPKEIIDERRLRVRQGWYGRVFDDTFGPPFA